MQIDACNEKTKVLYIAACGRSGSTLLGNVLGQIDGFFSVGELHHIWGRGFMENQLCGCGVPFLKCGVWRTVLDKAFGNIDHFDAHEMFSLHQSIRTRHLPLALIPQGRQWLASRLEKYLYNLDKLYRAIRSSTSCSVIVDSSKLALHGYLLGMIPSIDLYVIHLIRDPRAVAYSWLRKKKFQLDAINFIYMDQLNPLKSSVLWNIENIAAEIFWGRTPRRYRRLYYENFIDKPQESIECILDLVQKRALRLPIITGGKIELGTNHTISGNPIRFQTGGVKLQLDKEWKTKMKPSDKIPVTALTWPLLMRYGYVRKNG